MLRRPGPLPCRCRADAELRGRWVLRGEPALVNSSSPRYGEKASYYSAVCLETGEVEWMDLAGNSNSGTWAAFLDQLRRCPASTIFAGWRQSVLPVHLLGLAPLLGRIGAVAGDVKLQDDGVVHDPVNRRGGGHGVGKDAFPLREDQV